MSESKRGLMYIDHSTIRKTGQIVKVWEMVDLYLRSEDGDHSYKALTEYNCRYEEYRTINLTAFSGPMLSGVSGVVFKEGGPEWQPVVPNTPADTILIYVCHEWVKVGENDNSEIYMDASSFRRNGSIITFWALHNFKTNVNGFYSVRIQNEIDCNSRLSRTKDIRPHVNPMATGDIVNSGKLTNTEWKSMPSKLFSMCNKLG